LKELRDDIKDLKEHIKALEGNKKISKEDAERFPSSVDAAKKKVESTLFFFLSSLTLLIFFVALKDRLRKAEIKRTEKDDLKEVSTSTSKINYIDPRVTITWCVFQRVPCPSPFLNII
jgi:hypothetical protein